MAGLWSGCCPDKRGNPGRSGREGWASAEDGKGAGRKGAPAGGGGGAVWGGRLLRAGAGYCSSAGFRGRSLRPRKNTRKPRATTPRATPNSSGVGQ